MQAAPSQSEDHDWDKVSDDIPAADDEVIQDDTTDMAATTETEKNDQDEPKPDPKPEPSPEPSALVTEGNNQTTETKCNEHDGDKPEQPPKDKTTNANHIDVNVDAGDDTNPVGNNDVGGDDDAPTALQIVSIGTESDEYAFTFHDDALRRIMDEVPMQHKVCVVSVVGAFRTGKSFLLSWFLRYLNHHESANTSSEVEEKDEEVNGTKWFDKEDSLGNDGFNWRGGAERNTTGIWMWSKPFTLSRTNSEDGTKEDISVLLVDTQGMFDHETTMGLTAAIFGLSTLLSSYQIYNVDKRIQEDNLQQLALFSEYGRMALQTDGGGGGEGAKVEGDEVEKETEQAKAKTEKPKPFQRIEFLVRDWQNFEDDEDMDACEAEMMEYLESVLKERAAADLMDTRDQITSCFDEVSCFLMTHPGFAVTKKKYTGDTSVVEPTFKAFMDRYCKRVFENLVVKSIHGRELTAAELGAYIQTYAKMFESGAHFPEASTMLEATACANNTNATSLSIRKYKDAMDDLAGARCCDYLSPGELEQSHRNLFEDCIGMFDSIANFGNVKAIEEARNEVLKSIEDSFEMYSKLNESRNPLLGFETYVLPLLIGCVSATLRWITDFTCSGWSQTCKVGSDVLLHVYQVVFFFIVIIAATKAKQISQAVDRLKKALEVMSDNGSSNAKDKTE